MKNHPNYKIVITHQQYEATCKKQISLAQIFAKVALTFKFYSTFSPSLDPKLVKELNIRPYWSLPNFDCISLRTVLQCIQCMFYPKVVSSNDFRSKGRYTPYLTSRVSLIIHHTPNCPLMKKPSIVFLGLIIAHDLRG